ncbi:MAG: GNAT family N-acetyltransferase [Pedobacter sp.]|uniref:GNAT family N-acetyltransferase n=1 Tax=Pedobacter sp. TaxID=1411316 RepID=UPI003394F436
MTSFDKIRLETSRLYLCPLTYNQLLKYAALDDSLELELRLSPRARELNEDFKNTIETYLIPYINQHPDQILFATIWIIIHREQNIAVGDIGFNAGPSEKGVVEVGYSTYPGYMNQGYMTEALASISAWAFRHPGVNIIIAQTDRDNVATHRVLNKNNFMPFAEADNFLWWRLDKENQENYS